MSEQDPQRDPRNRRLSFIADVSLAHISLDAMLDEMLTRLRDTVDVDTVAVLLLDEDTGELVVRAAKGIEEKVELGVRVPVGKGFAGRVAAGHAPVILTDVEHADLVNPLLQEKGIKALLGVPLIFNGAVIGVLHVGSLRPRKFADDEQALLEMAATRIAPAIEHARLFDAERRAREEAQAAVAELQAIGALTDVILSNLGLDDLLHQLLGRLREVLHADTAAILIHDAESDELVARAARGIEGEVERGVRVPVGAGFAGRIAATREPVAVDDISTIEIHNPLLRERGICSLLGAPMMVEGNVTGVVHVGTLTPRHFEEADRRLLQLAADRIGLALDHDRLLREHHVALTLQQSLLPERLPELPGVTLAARYRPSPRTTIGGDWYDALPLPDGRVGLAIGDVVSRGLRAATVMAQIRTALRTYAFDGDEPSVVLERLGRVVRGLERREMVTLTYAVLDSSTRELTYATAGHPPPLVVDATGARYLEESGGAPLGALPYARYDDSTVRLRPDSIVVFYTDGLVERRDRTLSEGMERLAAAVESPEQSPEDVCEALFGELVDDETSDDVALLVARAAKRENELLELRLPAVSTSLVAMRRTLRQWLEQNGATPLDVTDVLVATGEACANAVEHAYGPGDARYEVRATFDGQTVEVAVTDFGRWRPPRGQNRGRGTLLMQELMDAFEVESTTDGTIVRMRRRIGMQVTA
jgi:serine phosphatase RsbU (regulator of sigma subunit)/anti-sigma regulatory factor (Ser/Thr protein kinase)/putative methionine-R-sulfoxide reductase with GAF domain